MERNLEDEIRDLKEKNTELVQETQYLKMSVAQKDREKLELMKEINELRLKLSRLRSGGAAQASKLDTAIQTTSENALSHLVQASGAIARTIELTKQYMQERQELESVSPRWNVAATPSREKIHKVPPLLLGGQSLQPVVALSRTLLNSSTRSQPRSPNQNSSLTERAVPVPMHMLQDLYIPLQRIDLADLQGNIEADEDMDNSEEDIVEDSNDQSVEESQNLSRIDEMDETRRLEVVAEEEEPDQTNETESSQTMQADETDNPLEGPSWLLDVLTDESGPLRENFEPDSTTTPCEEVVHRTPSPTGADANRDSQPGAAVAPPTSASPPRAFTPTVRRRKRTSTPPPPPPVAARAASKGSLASRNSGRVLQVVVSKMRLSLAHAPSPAGCDGCEGSPPKRARSPRSPAAAVPPLPANGSALDAPSPNGATDSGVVVSESEQESGAGEPAFVSVRSWKRRSRLHARAQSRDSSHSPSQSRARHHGHASRSPTDQSRASRPRADQSPSPSRSRSRSHDDSDDSDFADSRTRRARKPVSYKEKPLNRKMRR